MNRRQMLKLFGVVAAQSIWGCEKETVGLVYEQDEPEADTEPAEELPSEGYAILEKFVVILNDPSCSRHTHVLLVDPASYEDDTPISYLGGSHEVLMRPSELVDLAAGAKLPFATVGDGPGHGHCGTAWRESIHGGANPNLTDACVPLGTASCLPA